MFRKMRRHKQQISENDCITILEQEKRAAFSVIGDEGYPYTVPINFYYDKNDNKIYFHGAKEGHKADALKKCNKACFTVWNQGYKREGRWEWNVTSAVVFGKVVCIDDMDVKNDKLRLLAEKYYPTQKEIEDEITSPAFASAQLFAIEIEHMTGKLVNEK